MRVPDSFRLRVYLANAVLDFIEVHVCVIELQSKPLPRTLD